MAADLIGRNLGPYRILEQIGQGGMATVYKAYQPAMNRHVAVKVLPAHFMQDPTFAQRFEREAHTVARLVTRDGTLWLGTEVAGILRRDGDGWDTFGVEDGLPSTSVHVLYETSQGTLLAGTHYGEEAIRQLDEASWSTAPWVRPDIPPYRWNFPVRWPCLRTTTEDFWSA